MWRRRAIWLAMTLVLGSALPALATHDADHALDEIWAISDAAVQDIEARVNQFGASVSHLPDADAVTQAEKDAQAEIDAIWSAGRNEVDAVAAEYPGQLGGDVGEAKAAIADARNQGRAAIAALADEAITALAATTTSTTTTSTTTPTTTTTMATTTTTTAPATTTTTVRAGAAPPAQPPDDDEAEPPPADGAGLPLTDLTPTVDPAFSFSLTAESPSSLGFGEEVVAGGDTGAQKLAVALENVLPRELVDLVMSPFLILDIVFRAAVQDSRALTPLLALLGVALASIVVVDARTRRSAGIVPTLD